MVREAVVVMENGCLQAKVVRSEACASCHQCDFGKKEDFFVPIDDPNLKPGDIVTVDIPDKKVTGTAFILYGIPLVLTLIGLIAGYLLFGTDTAAVIGAAAGIAASFFVLKLLNGKLSVKPCITACGSENGSSKNT